MHILRFDLSVLRNNLSTRIRVVEFNPKESSFMMDWLKNLSEKDTCWIVYIRLRCVEKWMNS